MPAFLQNDHAEVFQIGSKRFLYPWCRVWITVTVDGYYRACDIHREPQKFSCSSQPGSFRYLSLQVAGNIYTLMR